LHYHCSYRSRWEQLLSTAKAAGLALRPKRRSPSPPQPLLLQSQREHC
jgi:hypothetical protein